MITWLKHLFRTSLSPVERAAQSAFTTDFPSERIAWSVLKSDESGAYVACVFSGQMRPRQSKFYRVDKQTLAALLIEDDKQYRPKVQR